MPKEDTPQAEPTSVEEMKQQIAAMEEQEKQTCLDKIKAVLDEYDMSLVAQPQIGYDPATQSVKLAAQIVIVKNGPKT